MSSKSFREYQIEADEAIYQSLTVDGDSKCLVKMFCGTGKSLVMRKCKVVQNLALCVYVFPSLGLIRQFTEDYLGDLPIDHVLNISSLKESTDEITVRQNQKKNKIPATTDPTEILEFMKSLCANKVVCVTYQSLNTLLDNLGGNRIDIAVFDEAHHAFGDEYQKLIFEHDVYEKQLFFTATPIQDKLHMYGKQVFEYTYLQGVEFDVINPFEIRIDMYSENTNKSIYESIARAILASGNSRVLTFHKDVKTERDTSVRNFVDNEAFNECFERIAATEFPEKAGYYNSVYMVGLDSDVKQDAKRDMLRDFDATPDNKVYVISSCKTIGEGIDTKNANMCVFADPKASVIEIIQNIGRISRKLENIEKPNSTILIPCWVDKTKYLACDGDREKCDAALREDMNESGDFNGILKVLSALKQEDEELYDICLRYPSRFAPRELDMNWSRRGLELKDAVDDEDGELRANLGYVVGRDIDYEDYDDCEDEELIERIAEDNDVCVEIHTDSLDNPIERYNENCESGDIVRLYREVDEDTGTTKYQPIVSKESGETHSRIRGVSPDPKKRMGLNVHTNPDVKVLWGVVGEVDMNREICSCIIDCEVVRQDPMEVAEGIVERAKLREANGGRLLPRRIDNVNNRKTILLEQQHNDAVKLCNWKQQLRANSNYLISNGVCNYLDENLHGWKTQIDFDKKAMEDADNIVKRARLREANGGRLLPRQMNKNCITSHESEQEIRDAQKLCCWKRALNGTGKFWNCSNEVRDYLDENLPGWRTEIDFNKKAMEYAIDIVERSRLRESNGGRLLPRILDKNKRTTLELEKESKDAMKLNNWKRALLGNNDQKCCDSVRDYLDINLHGWRRDLNETAMKDAIDIVKRAKIRKQRGGKLLPSKIHDKKNRTTPEPELEQETNDALKLGRWKRALKDNGGICSDEVRDYLDENLPGWRTEIDFDKKAIEHAIGIVQRARTRESNGGRLLPRGIHKKNRKTQELEQENKDNGKLNKWSCALEGKGSSICSDELRDYLDANLPRWKKSNKNKTDQTSPKIHTETTKTIRVKRKKPMNLVISQPNPTSEQDQDQNQEQQKEQRRRNKSIIEELHQRYKTSNSSTLATRFDQNPQEWHDYHAITEANDDTYDDPTQIPRNQIIAELEKIKSTSQKHVVDLGCGKAHISKHFASINSNQFRFTNYDFVAFDDTISVGDISNLLDKIPDNSVNIAILSLAMWCTNREDNIKEAYRILDNQGYLYISEATKKWSKTDEHDRVIAGTEACELIEMLEQNGFQIIKRKIEKFSVFVCLKM